MKRSHRPPEVVSESFQKRLDLYALAASAAGVSLFALAQPVEAEIVYTPTNRSIGINTPFNLDLNHDGIADFQLWNKYSFNIAIEAKLGIKPMLATNRIAGDSEFAAAFPGGVLIDRNTHFPSKGDGVMVWWFYSFSSTICCGSYGPWRNVQNRYLGLKFSINGETHFGWARLSVKFFAPNITATLTGYAYETEANKAIKTGQTAEGSPSASLTPPSRKAPSVGALGVLAIGSAVQSIWRREETPTLLQMAGPGGNRDQSSSSDNFESLGR